MKAILYHLLLLGLIPSYLHAEPSDLENARVTIPYNELKELLQAAQLSENKKPKPPLEAALISAKYLLDFSGSVPKMTANFEARAFTENWHSLPLFGGNARLESSQGDETVSVVWKDHAYTLLINGEGNFQNRLTLTIPPIAQWNKESGFRFSPSTATQNQFQVTGLPKGKILRIGDLTPSRFADGNTIYHFSGDEKELNIYLDEQKGETPVLPSIWTLHSQIMIRYLEGRLQHSARIQARADAGSGLSMNLSLPPNVSRVTVEGEDLESWKLAPRTKDSRSLEVSWKTRDTLERTVQLTWETPQSALSDTWVLTPPHLGGPDDPAREPSKTLIALLPVDGLELIHPSLQPGGESRRLSEWLRTQLGSDDYFISELTGHSPMSLAAKWLPRLNTAQATVSLANFETRIVPDGSMLVSADYTIQHSAPINWTIQLPAVDQILACEINHKAANPIQREQNKIEFRLPSPAISNEDEASGTTIHLCYALQDEELDPVSGQMTLELPQTDLFIHRLEWSLVIPDQYEPTAVEGNVQLAIDQLSSQEQRENLIRLEKELCRGERPAVEIYYQRKELTPGS